MRPAYLTPKLTDPNRLEIRRLRAENPRTWTLAKLAAKFGVHRSTISHVLRKRMRASAEQELAALRAVVESSGTIDTEELITLKHQEWNCQLLAESDLGRQQQLVNLIKSVGPLLEDAEEKRTAWRYAPEGSKDDERRAIKALEEMEWENLAETEHDQSGADSKPTLLHSAPLAASAD